MTLAHDDTRLASDKWGALANLVTRALWGIAIVAMAASAADSWVTFQNLHTYPAVGVITALTVDASLAVWLHINKQLRDADIKSRWGQIHEVITGGMTAYLNAGAALFDGISPGAAKAALTVAHCFVPAVLILSCLTFGDALRKLRAARQQRELADQAQREAQDAARRAEYQAEQRERREQEIQRAKGELIDATDYLKAAGEKRRAAELEVAAERNALCELEVLRAEREQRQAEEAAAREAEQKAARAVAERKPAPARKPATRSNRKTPATAEEIRAWIRGQRASGQQVTTAQVVEFAGIRRGNESKLIKQVEDEIDAELVKVASGEAAQC